MRNVMSDSPHTEPRSLLERLREALRSLLPPPGECPSCRHSDPAHGESCGCGKHDDGPAGEREAGEAEKRTDKAVWPAPQIGDVTRDAILLIKCH
jgi:hypothetical protein